MVDALRTCLKTHTAVWRMNLVGRKELSSEGYDKPCTILCTVVATAILADVSAVVQSVWAIPRIQLSGRHRPKGKTTCARGSKAASESGAAQHRHKKQISQTQPTRARVFVILVRAAPAGMRLQVACLYYDITTQVRSTPKEAGCPQAANFPE